jgi:hypothetical protein
MRPIAIPPYLPAAAPQSETLAALALTLYREVAATAGEAARQRQAARHEVERHTRETGHILGRLAAMRFEFARLLVRIRPQLAGAAGEDVFRLLDLFARGWDVELERTEIEVRDVNGQPMTDELAERIEVLGAVPDPACSEATVRETLSPLVLWAGRVVGVARVITSVPTVREDSAGNSAGKTREEP